MKQVDLDNISPGTKIAATRKRVRGRRKLSVWLDLLTQLAAYDENTDSRIKRNKTWSVIGGILLFVTIFGLIIVGNSLSNHSLLPLILVVGGIIIVSEIIFLITMFVLLYKLNKINLINDFRITILPVLETFEDDIGAKGKVTLDLDLSPHNDKKKITRKENIPPGRFKKLVRTIYNNPWCHLTAYLADGTALMLTMKHISVSFDRYWRNCRGKYKHKRKWKQTVSVTAALVPAGNKLVWCDDKIGELDTQSTMKMAEKKGSRICKLTQCFKFKSVHDLPEEYVKPEEIVGMYIKLYSVLNPTPTIQPSCKA
ncbi:MAG: hypothetical protein ACMUJM_23515 [bacterium]